MSTDQVVVITGCSSGIGFASAKKLAQKGHRVYATMRSVDGKNAEPAKALRQYAEQESVRLRVLELDVTSDESVNRAIAQIAEDEGRIDVVINNAGRGYYGPGEAFSSEQLAAQLDVSLLGPFRVNKAATPHMRRQKSGLIIHVSSTFGRVAAPGTSPYNAAKWGLEGWVEAIRLETSVLGIDQVIVEPGPFETNLFIGAIPPADSSVAAAYPHVREFLEAVGEMFQGQLADPEVPTDPDLVADAFDKLIDTPADQRPLRTTVGLDGGVQAINDTMEPIRRQLLAAMHLTALDGVKGE